MCGLIVEHWHAMSCVKQFQLMSRWQSGGHLSYFSVYQKRNTNQVFHHVLHLGWRKSRYTVGKPKFITVFPNWEKLWLSYSFQSACQCGIHFTRITYTIVSPWLSFYWYFTPSVLFAAAEANFSKFGKQAKCRQAMSPLEAMVHSTFCPGLWLINIVYLTRLRV